MKVTQFYNKNQFDIRNNGERWLQSYDSIVAKIDKDGQLCLGYDWDYSRTTLKHLYLWLKEQYEYANYCDRLTPQHLINQRQGVLAALRASNKRKAFQALIDAKIIHYVDLEDWR